MEPQLKSLMQIGIIVRNVDAAVKQYEAMGVGPWDVTVMDNTVAPFDDLTFDGKPLATKGPILKTAMMTRYGTEIELIEPLAPGTAYYDWLQEHGPGLHHLAFDLDKPYEQFLQDCEAKTGKKPWVRGQAIHGIMDFSYVDLREEMGIIVECYKSLQPGKPLLPFAKEPEVVK